MVETVHLLPPASGLQSDPRLFGVAHALAQIFPVEPSKTSGRAERGARPASEAGRHARRAPALAV